MILVIEAGYHGMVAFSAWSTFPVSTSTRICASAAARETEKLAVTQRASPQVSVRAMVLSRQSITSLSGFYGLGNHAVRNNLGGYVNRSRGQKQNGTLVTADEPAFKKRTKLTVMSSFSCLTVFVAPYGVQASAAAMRP